MRFSPEVSYRLKTLRRRWGRSLVQSGIALCVTVACALFHLSVGSFLDISLLVPFYALRGPRQTPPNVIIVAVDDVSYQVLGASTNYPLPRRHLATALEAIQKQKPGLVIVDAKIPNERLIDPAADERIAAVLAALPSTIWSGENPRDPDLDHDRVQVPSDERFRAAAKMELPMLVYGNGSYITYLTNREPSAHSIDDLVPLAKPLRVLGNLSLALPGRYDLINFYGPVGTVPRISIHTLVTGSATEEALSKLNNAVVLLGYQSLQYGRGTTSKEELPTPAAPDGMFGVEIHASVVGNLLDGSMLRLVDPGMQFAVMCGLIAVFSAFAMRYPHPFTLVIIWTGYSAALVVAYFMFSARHVIFLGLSSLGFASLIVSVGMGAYFFLRATSYKAYVDRVFSFEREREF